MWKDIKGYEGFYEISSDGIVRSKDRQLIDKIGRVRFWKGQNLKPNLGDNGYYMVTLTINRKRKWVYIHRLVAEHFINNPLGFPQVNHKDGNKLNNDLNNLEWCTARYNTIHAYKHGLINHVRGVNHFNYGKFGANSKKAKKVIGTNTITNETKEYGAIIETKKDGFSPSEVSRCCNYGGIHKGYSFEFINMI